MEYGDNYDNFKNAIKKAKTTCKKSGYSVDNNFSVMSRKSLGRPAEDYILSRYACLLIAQNADSNKQAVADAQTYFAIQTRKQEVFEEMVSGLSKDEKRIYLRNQTKTGNSSLSKTAREAGVKNMAEFHNWGYWGLYDIQTVEEIKARKGMSENDNLLDNIGAVELGANLFRITQTDYKIKNEEINTQQKVNQAHRKVGMNVRNAIMANNGELPENLPKEEPIKEVEKRLKVKQNHADELELF